MVNKCIAPNCNSGYQSNKSIEKVAKFKFPVDAERRKKWICAVPRKEWEPTKNSVLLYGEKLSRGETFAR